MKLLAAYCLIFFLIFGLMIKYGYIYVFTILHYLYLHIFGTHTCVLNHCLDFWIRWMDIFCRFGLFFVTARISCSSLFSVIVWCIQFSLTFFFCKFQVFFVISVSFLLLLIATAPNRVLLDFPRPDCGPPRGCLGAQGHVRRCPRVNMSTRAFTCASPRVQARVFYSHLPRIPFLTK